MSIETAVIKYLDLAGPSNHYRNRGPAREALDTLNYLISEFERWQTIDRINMLHVYKAAARLKAAIDLADGIVEEVGVPVERQLRMAVE